MGDSEMQKRIHLHFSSKVNINLDGKKSGQDPPDIVLYSSWIELHCLALLHLKFATL